LNVFVEFRNVDELHKPKDIVDFDYDGLAEKVPNWYFDVYQTNLTEFQLEWNGPIVKKTSLQPHILQLNLTCVAYVETVRIEIFNELI